MATALVGAAALVVGLPSLASAATAVGPDYVASDNVQFIENIRLPGNAAGAKVVGHYLYVTSDKDIEIYDITVPESPQLVSRLTDTEIGWENEQVPSNGTIMGFSQQGTGYAFLSAGGCATVNGNPSNCLVIWDVRDVANPAIIATVSGAGDHTSTCVFDCSYMVGSSGSVTDLTQVLAPGHPASKISVGAKGWQTGLPGKSCHNQTQVAAGIVLAACEPFMLLTMRAQDGASLVHPRLIATGSFADHRFIHGVDWPSNGTDRFALVGGETNVTPNCDAQQSAAFSTWDASRAYSTGHFYEIDEYHLHNGDYLNGSPPANVSGCSTHWFEAHPTFHNGGLVALADYEHGDRFLQILPNGKINEVGLFEPLGGAASAMHWAAGGRVVYSIDYQRGIDVLRWNGPLYVPGGGTAAAGTTTSGGAETPSAAVAATATSTPNTAAAAPAAAAPIAAVVAVGLLGRRRRRHAGQRRGVA